jgi:hypothetical protein
MQRLLDLVNTNASPSLQGADGLAGEDLVTDYPGTAPPEQVEFNLRARSQGWDAAQIQVALSGSPTFVISPSGTNGLDDNLGDLEPRNHLYITAGVTNLPLTFACNTTTQADGYHGLTAVAYEGSHVRVQQRTDQTVRFLNSALSANFASLLGGSNTDLSATLQFSVAANTNNVSKIELFSTGGSLGSVTGQSSALFSVAGTNLGLGLHPFYALVIAGNGKQYRTDTKWIRLLGAEPPFKVSISATPATLGWPATVGRSYDVLSTTNLSNAFQLSAAVTPTNSAALWTDTNTGARQRFYRVRTSN